MAFVCLFFFPIWISELLYFCILFNRGFLEKLQEHNLFSYSELSVILTNIKDKNPSKFPIFSKPAGSLFSPPLLSLLAPITNAALLHLQHLSGNALPCPLSLLPQFLFQAVTQLHSDPTALPHFRAASSRPLGTWLQTGLFTPAEMGLSSTQLQGFPSTNHFMEAKHQLTHICALYRSAFWLSLPATCAEGPAKRYSAPRLWRPKSHGDSELPS